MSYYKFMAKEPITSEIIELKKKLEENPDSLVFAPLADAYRKHGELEEAFNICKKGLEKHPNYTSARVVLGRIYQEQQKIQQAASEFKKVLETDPENLMAHSLLGAIYVAQGDCQSAIEEYQKILTLNPDDEDTQEALKQAIEKAAGDQKSDNKPKKELLATEKKTPQKESTASLTIAELYLKQGHFDKAIEVFQELLANDPQNLMLRQKLVEVVDRQQKVSAVDTTLVKLKKNEFIQPPDHKEDVLEETRADSKRPGKVKKDDDTKFTSEDILQVMRRGGKDDVVIEEKSNFSGLRNSKPVPDVKINNPEKKDSILSSLEQTENLKGILSDLGSIDGIMRCFITGSDGINIVSVGESGNNSTLGKQAAIIFDSTNRSVAQLNQGKLHQVLITADSGHILLVAFTNFVLIVLANSKINLGLLRLALDSAIKKLDRIL
jgi:tetratricopeptide (TPR) repeat protein